MNNKYGPTRSEVKFRLICSIAGLALTGAALLYRGLPTGPGAWDAITIAIVFFGGILIWSLRKLIRLDHT